MTHPSYPANTLRIGIFLVFFMLLLTCNSLQDQKTPELIHLDLETLTEIRQRLQKEDPPLMPALKRLVQEADQALQSGPFSVTHKPMLPPSGDKKDYMSVGPFWWPDPDSEDGLPYIRRDGEVNPERHEYDNVRMGQLSNAVQTLGLAYFFTGNEVYARHAAELLRVWFIDEQTSMNPHLRYAQAIPGHNEGRYIGLIDTGSLLAMLDAIQMVAVSSAWTARDDRALRDWFAEYKTWFIKSDFGRDESAHPNNHGTWHDAQATGYALFVGDTITAKRILQQVAERRIAAHIEPDGRQPRELKRTQGFSYSIYNLLGLTLLANLAPDFSIDLWKYETPDGRSITGALDWLLPYAIDFNLKRFEYQQINPPNLRGAEIVYRRAARATGENSYMEAAMLIGGAEPDDRIHLLYPLH